VLPTDGDLKQKNIQCNLMKWNRKNNFVWDAKWETTTIKKTKFEKKNIYKILVLVEIKAELRHSRGK
jgi:hypothetical protein